jgi:hypothetical protein
LTKNKIIFTALFSQIIYLHFPPLFDVGIGPMNSSNGWLIVANWLMGPMPPYNQGRIVVVVPPWVGHYKVVVVDDGDGEGGGQQVDDAVGQLGWPQRTLPNRPIQKEWMDLNFRFPHSRDSEFPPIDMDDIFLPIFTLK